MNIPRRTVAASSASQPSNSPRPGARAGRTYGPIRGRARVATALFAALALTACDDIGGIDDGLDVQAAALDVTPPGAATRSYTVTAAGGASPSPVRLRVGVNQLNATWLDGGRAETGAGQLTLVVTSLSEGITFRSLGGNRATLTVPTTATAAFAELRAQRADGSATFAADLDLVVDR